jgi:hypothetical protein
MKEPLLQTFTELTVSVFVRGNTTLFTWTVYFLSRMLRPHTPAIIGYKLQDHTMKIIC